MRNILTLLVAVVFLSGCARLDLSKMPLYDEVINPPVEDKDLPPRRSPPGNPVTMPPGYEKPTFPPNAPDPSATLEGYEQHNAQTELEPVYPSLNTVPPRPKNIMTQAQRSDTMEMLDDQRVGSQSVQQQIASGEGVPHGKIALQNATAEEAGTPWKTLGDGVVQKAAPLPKHAVGARQPVKPVQLIPPSGAPEGYEKSVASQLKQHDMTHEFGTPKIDDDAGHSALTVSNQVGFKSLEDKAEQEKQFHLPPFRYTDVPKINDLTPPKEVVERTDFGNQTPPTYLQESRYRDRARSNYYRGNFYGHTYFSNQ